MGRADAGTLPGAGFGVWLLVRDSWGCSPTAEWSRDTGPGSVRGGREPPSEQAKVAGPAIELRPAGALPRAAGRQAQRVAAERLRGQGSNLHQPASKAGELPITPPRSEEPGGGVEPPIFALRKRRSGQPSYPGTGAGSRARTDCLRSTGPPLYLMSYPGVDWETGHDPAPPAWKTGTLPACATPRWVRAARVERARAGLGGS